MRALLITDLSLANADDTLRRARAISAAFGEAVTFAVRDHSAPVRDRLTLARALVDSGARVVVHERCDLALASAADGVQLGEASIEVCDARALLGGRAWIGRSCHDARGLVAAHAAGANAATLSPLFASPGKGDALGEARFAEIRALAPELTVYALGGLDESNAASARAAGADGVAAVRAWLASADPVRTVRAMIAR